MFFSGNKVLSTSVILDHELKNIIDKLASFVARNGPEFEQMTKQKQKDNPKFSFLFGGDLFNYYKFKGMYIYYVLVTGNSSFDLFKILSSTNFFYISAGFLGASQGCVKKQNNTWI